MKKVSIGLGIGLGIGIGVTLVLQALFTVDDVDVVIPGTPAVGDELLLPAKPHVQEVKLSDAVARSTLDQAPTRRFESGECWLRIGEGFVFGETSVRPGPSRAQVDIYCMDIRHGVSLACPHGAIPAIPTLTSIGLPKSPSAAAALIRDAPLHLPQRRVWLRETCEAQQSGIGLVQAGDGATYKLYLVELSGHPEALERRVRVRYEAVSKAKGGGTFDLPEIDGAQSIGAVTRADIRTAIEVGGAIPGANFFTRLKGDYEVLDKLLPDLKIHESKHLVVDGLLDERIELRGGGSVWIPKRLPEGSEVTIGTSGGAIGVGEDLDGKVRVKGYGHVHVGGSIRGLLDVSSYGSVVILGDLYGTVKARSYVDLYLRGRIYGKLDVHGSCWSTFYLQSFVSRAELEAMPGSSSVTLHLAQSDLPAGTHENIGSWDKVIVGDPVWKTLMR